ncbi:MAG TPA: PfkB family carbohydrate kinase [Ferruginibacter sp.]|nr:PfkB family carbohydrate kinase [Ferruginibacter sp.]HMP22349.1 PfkB family carbohydrate kinase [Ferruginibacter sp.]
MSGSRPAGMPDYFYGLIVKTANAAGAKCIVDTSRSALQALKGRGAYLIKPNISELRKLLNSPDLGPMEIDDAAQQVIADGYAEIAAISMGPQGRWIVSKDEKYFVTAPKAEKRSTVGAGDSMVAGLTSMLLLQKSLKEAVAFGMACSTAATMNAGT